MKETVTEAARVLKAGGLILYPTDTIWGIGCDATNAEAVAKVFALKRRDEAKSLVLLAADLDMVGRYVRESGDRAQEQGQGKDQGQDLLHRQ